MKPTDRCCGCGKVLLNYPEPYLGDPAEIDRAVAAGHLPIWHVAAQREALIWCDDCTRLNEKQTAALMAARRAGMDSPHRGWGGCSSGAGYEDRRDEWEDVTTGAKGKL